MSGFTPADGAPGALAARIITMAGLRLATRVNTVARAALARLEPLVHRD